MSTYTRSENLADSEINIPPPPEVAQMSDMYNMSTTERKSLNFLSDDISEGFSWEKDVSPPPPTSITTPDVLEIPPSPPLLWRERMGKSKSRTTTPSARTMEKELRKGNLPKERLDFIRKTMLTKKRSCIPQKYWSKDIKARERLRKFFIDQIPLPKTN